MNLTYLNIWKFTAVKGKSPYSPFFLIEFITKPMEGEIPDFKKKPLTTLKCLFRSLSTIL